MDKGAYLLIMKLKGQAISIGRLGLLEFSSGYFVYVGSAMNGLRARVSRHRKQKKKLHWHIDYLLRKAELIRVLEFPSNKRQECELSHKLRHIAHSELKGFGASDCKCNSHLYFFSKLPDIEKLEALLCGRKA
jgi:sugar fermentation stimulation protein A